MKKNQKAVKSWYCQSFLNGNRDTHAFCLLRSPYRKSIQKKIVELCEGHPFRDWQIGVVEGETLDGLLKLNLEYDTLYIRDAVVEGSDKASNESMNA